MRQDPPAKQNKNGLMAVTSLISKTNLEISNKHEIYIKYQQEHNFPKQKSVSKYNVVHLQYELYRSVGLE